MEPHALGAGWRFASIGEGEHEIEELPALAYLGHSCPEYAISLAAEARARRVCLFHHARRRTDDALDELAGRYAGCAIPVFAAADGLMLRLGRPGSGRAEWPPS